MAAGQDEPRIRGIDGLIAPGDSFFDDRHPDLRADFILANPPFNVSDWGGERLTGDKRWQYGVPPKGNANFAWVQHMAHHLAPPESPASCSPTARCRRANRAKAPSARIWSRPTWWTAWRRCRDSFSTRPRFPSACGSWPAAAKNGKFRNRSGEILFIDARKLGRMTDRTHRELDDADIARIADTYHAWRGEADAGEYADAPGFCKSATLEEVRKHGHVLTPGRYVGAEPQADDGEPFEQKMRRLAAQWRGQQAEAAKLDAAIAANLKALGFGED